MMKQLLVLFLTFSAQLMPAQNDAVKKEDTNIYALKNLESKPEFPGGLPKFYEFFNAHFKLVEGTKDNAKSPLFVRFVVEKDGSLSDITLLRDGYSSSGKEAIRVLQLSPKWIPGKQNGKVVRVDYVLPVKFSNTNPPAKK